MPLLLIFRWLNEFCAFLAGGDVLAIQPSSSFQNAISGTWADSDDVVVKHHECQSSVTFQSVFAVGVKNGLFPPLLEPPITRYFTIVTVDFSVALEPVVVLTGGQLGPLEQFFAWQVTTLGPVLHVVDNLVADFVGR